MDFNLARLPSQDSGTGDDDQGCLVSYRAPHIFQLITLIYPLPLMPVLVRMQPLMSLVRGKRDAFIYVQSMFRLAPVIWNTPGGVACSSRDTALPMHGGRRSDPAWCMTRSDIPAKARSSPSPAVKKRRNTDDSATASRLLRAMTSVVLIFFPDEECRDCVRVAAPGSLEEAGSRIIHVIILHLDAPFGLPARLEKAYRDLPQRQNA
ncbi:hypothetical protein BDV96DRAFT_600630 [Lophiotrema nucula]|uniref:Uncharacterized protein n=1 Tax=Lophiotrema nucula TaxID=690887 RepID=A0A6A5Z6A2_9PLEO|nr:hypothetical protein BDV96DRAFT_600630 [Lophiotrema nucula]